MKAHEKAIRHNGPVTLLWLVLSLVFVNFSALYLHAFDTLFFVALSPIMSTTIGQVDKCGVSKALISARGRRSVAEVEYSFNVDGHKYRGGRVGINGGFVRHDSDAQKIVSELSGGATVRYLAASPSISYVVIDKKHNHYAPILFVLPIIW